VDEVVAAQISTPLAPPHTIIPELSLPTSEAITKAMAKKPEERFASYEEFRMALEAARSQLLVSQFTGRTSPTTGTRETRSWWRR
jgi:hypothetical protein